MATDPYAGLDTRLAAAVRQLIAAAGGRVTITSGFRSYQQQAALYANRANSPYPVAAPGTSSHEQGLAVDLGGDLALARRLAPQFGLTQPYPNDPVHFELVSTRQTMSTSAAGGRYPNWMDRLEVWKQAVGGDVISIGSFAAAVSMAENSTGYANTISKPNRNGSVDIGLWQINSSHIGQTFTGPNGQPFTIQSQQWLQDPNNNALAAYAISGGGRNWKPWCTAWSDNACGTKGGQYLERGSRAVDIYQSVLGTATSGTGLAGLLSLGAAGPGSTQIQGPQPGAPDAIRTKCSPGVDVWKVGPFTVLNQCQAQSLGGSLLIIAGGLVMLTGTIVILFRFQGTRDIAATATSAVPYAGPAVSTLAGRGPGPGPAIRRSQKGVARSQREREEREAARPQQAYDIAKAREQGRQSGRVRVSGGGSDEPF